MASVTTIMLDESVESVNSLEDDVHEVIRGANVERPDMGTYPFEVATILAAHLDLFVRQSGLGRFIVEALFRIDEATQYRPDIAFISSEKWPIHLRTPRKQPWEVVPDIAIEVSSETDRASDVLSKAHHYLQAGVRAVWLIYPDLEIIHRFRSITTIEVLTKDHILDGGDLIPGFQIPLSVLFAGEAPEEDSQLAD